MSQSTTNGYFGGYMGKRQPAGRLETKKCVQKMYTLRGRIEGKSLEAQERAASARMVTDLEMSSTLRGAVELFNLARGSIVWMWNYREALALNTSALFLQHLGLVFAHRGVHLHTQTFMVSDHSVTLGTFCHHSNL